MRRNADYLKIMSFARAAEADWLKSTGSKEVHKKLINGESITSAQREELFKTKESINQQMISGGFFKNEKAVLKFTRKLFEQMRVNPDFACLNKWFSTTSLRARIMCRRSKRVYFFFPKTQAGDCFFLLNNDTDKYKLTLPRRPKGERKSRGVFSLPAEFIAKQKEVEEALSKPAELFTIYMDDTPLTVIRDGLNYGFINADTKAMIAKAENPNLVKLMNGRDTILKFGLIDLL